MTSDEPRDLMAALEDSLAPITPHRYTVDAVLIGAEPYPCVVCGKGREARVHIDRSGER